MDSSSIKLFAPFGALIALLVFVVTFAIGLPLIVAAIAGVVLGVTIVVLLFHQSDALVLKGLRVQNADAAPPIGTMIGVDHNDTLVAQSQVIWK